MWLIIVIKFLKIKVIVIAIVLVVKVLVVVVVIIYVVVEMMKGRGFQNRLPKCKHDDYDVSTGEDVVNFLDYCYLL